ncbi:MAG: hypothetical protein WKF37_09325 [Bryobacteraceae bacterium]
MVGKAATLLALKAVEPVWVLGRAGLEWRRQTEEWRQHVWKNFSPGYQLINTRYEVLGSDGKKVTLEWHDSASSPSARRWPRLRRWSRGSLSRALLMLSRRVGRSWWLKLCQ